MFRTIHFPTIDSTHTWAMAHARSHTSEPLFITADEQTSSITRKAHTAWIAPPNTCLLATFLIPHTTPFPLHNLAQVLSYSVMRSLKSLHIFPLFKWPNDLLLSDKKVCGVMADICEGALVVSCGLNVNISSQDLAKIDIPATSLFHETGKIFDISLLGSSLCAQFSSDFAKLQQKGFAPFKKCIEKNLAFFGKNISIDGPEKVTGIVKGLTSDGRLILDICGIEKEILSGSILK